MAWTRLARSPNLPLEDALQLIHLYCEQDFPKAEPFEVEMDELDTGGMLACRGLGMLALLRRGQCLRDIAPRCRDAFVSSDCLRSLSWR